MVIQGDRCGHWYLTIQQKSVLTATLRKKKTKIITRGSDLRERPREAAHFTQFQFALLGVFSIKKLIPRYLLHQKSPFFFIFMWVCIESKEAKKCSNWITPNSKWKETLR